MSLGRRAPPVFLDGSELLFAALIAKHLGPQRRNECSVRRNRDYALELEVTDEDLWLTFGLIALAKTMSWLRNLARWVGKGGRLEIEATRITVNVPERIREAVQHYERRRQLRMLASGGFFAPNSQPVIESQVRIPTLIRSEWMTEAPLGSGRWLRFERYPAMVDGQDFARLIKAYDDPLQDLFRASADAVLHALTALATLIEYSSPILTRHDGYFATHPAVDQDTEEREIGFAFGLGRKGFLRFPRDDLIRKMGHVRTIFVRDDRSGEDLAREFVNSISGRSLERSESDVIAGRAVPFIHPSSDDYVYVDILLLGDFIEGLLERVKDWYASQHGDRFVLDLKRWLEREVPGALRGFRRPVSLARGRTDIDLLVSDKHRLWAIECKAYAKSRAFMVGAPQAVAQRRGKIREAVAQAKRGAAALAREISGGLTEFDPSIPVEWLVCCPSQEFLLPLGEHGMASPSVPRVLTPEELLSLVSSAAE